MARTQHLLRPTRGKILLTLLLLLCTFVIFDVLVHLWKLYASTPCIPLNVAMAGGPASCGDASYPLVLTLNVLKLLSYAAAVLMPYILACSVVHGYTMRRWYTYFNSSLAALIFVLSVWWVYFFTGVVVRLDTTTRFNSTRIPEELVLTDYKFEPVGTFSHLTLTRYYKARASAQETKTLLTEAFAHSGYNLEEDYRGTLRFKYKGEDSWELKVEFNCTLCDEPGEDVEVTDVSITDGY